MTSNKATFISHQSLVNVILLPFLALGILVGFADPVSGATIDGTVSLPSGQTAPAGGIHINISADDDNYGSGNGSSSVTIPEGSPSGIYTMTVPDDATASWRISYYYGGNDYLQKGYYATSATTWDYDGATLLAGAQDHANIDMTLLTGNTISGTVALPAGQTAPAGGIYITIYANDNNYGGGNVSSSVTIPEGSPYGTYTMNVPDDATASWQVSYHYGGNDYLQDGYYATSGTTWDYNGATLLAGAQDHANIDMTLLTGNTISGTVALPAGQTAPAGGIYINIDAGDANWGGGYAYSSVTIPEGSPSGTYTMTVPDDATASWRVSYSYWGNDYLQYGYYATPGTTWNSDATTLLTGGQDHTGIDMTLLIGNTISGTVSLPTGQTAPAGGVEVSIQADDNNNDGGGSGYDSVTIPQGASSVSYTMRVPDDATASWRVRYSYWGSDYLGEGYYTTTATTWDQNAATLLPGGQDHTSIDITLLTGNTISGTVSLPSGQTAPTGGVDIQIQAHDNHGGVYSNSAVTIPEGASFGSYTMRVPNDTAASWLVNYYYWGSDYLQYGYYASPGTNWNSAAATLLAGGQDYAGIDMTLLTGNTISGTVLLPSGQTAPVGGIAVSINANDDNDGGGYAYSSVTIPEGSPSGTYTLRVPDDASASWRVSYSDWWGNSDYLPWGYYASGGTIWKYSDATLLPGGQDYTGIDLSLLVIPTITIQGSICLPVGTIAREYLFVDIYLYDTENNIYSNSFYWNYQFPVGENCLTYQVEVPMGASETWRVGYFVWDSNFVQGYYSSTGTVKKYSEATHLSAAQDHSGIDMTILRAGGTFPWNMFLPAIIGRTTR